MDVLNYISNFLFHNLLISGLGTEADNVPVSGIESSAIQIPVNPAPNPQVGACEA